MRVPDFHNLYLNDRVPTADGKRTEAVSLVWMRSPARKTYTGGVVFNPGVHTDETAYNLWRGFTPGEEGGSCDLLVQHVRDVICSRDDKQYRWLFGWMAHIVQHPEEKPGTAVVLKGVKGAGKDIVGHYLGALFRRNYVKVSQSDQLTGRFNAHMEQALLLHVEEGHWAGDRKAEGQLKSMITSPRIAIERKGIDVIQIDSFMRVLITSNEDWVVPATPGERRFFVPKVSPSVAKRKAYFDPLWTELVNGGPAALFDLLRDYDLGGFDVRNPPETEGLREQKLATLRGVEAWWRDMLVEGELPSSRDFDETIWSEGATWVESEALYSVCAAWLQVRRFKGDVPSIEEFGKKLRALVPGIERGQRRHRDGSGRFWSYRIPKLIECRAAFDKLMGHPGDWEAYDVTDVTDMPRHS